MIFKHVPRFNAEDKIVPSFSSQGLSHRRCVSLQEEEMGSVLRCDCEAFRRINLSSTHIYTQGRFRIEVMREELQAITLATAYIKHSQSFQILKPSRYKSRFIVKLQLEDVSSA